MSAMLLFALVLAPEQPSRDPVHTGIALLRMCEDADDKKPITVDSAGCASYIIGSADASLFYSQLYSSEVPFRVFCAPKEATYAQYVKVVVKYLRDHPERLHESRQLLVQDALHAAFPCRK